MLYVLDKAKYKIKTLVVGNSKAFKSLSEKVRMSGAVPRDLVKIRTLIH